MTAGPQPVACQALGDFKLQSLSSSTGRNHRHAQYNAPPNDCGFWLWISHCGRQTGMKRRCACRSRRSSTRPTTPFTSAATDRLGLGPAGILTPAFKLGVSHLERQGTTQHGYFRTTVASEYQWEVERDPPAWKPILKRKKARRWCKVWDGNGVVVFSVFDFAGYLEEGAPPGRLLKGGIAESFTARINFFSSSRSSCTRPTRQEGRKKDVEVT